MSGHTLLIGLDGATFQILDPLMEQGVMPFLRSFMAGGVRADLRTIVPPLTPPAWTSLMTGRRPGKHGVFDFFQLESRETKTIRFFTSHDIGCDTVWTLAASAGRRVTSLNFPAMFPPPRIDGQIIPGWMPWRQLRLGCWPQDMFDSLKSLPGFNPRELAMDYKLEERATEGCDDHNEYKSWIELHKRREENWFAIFEHFHKTSPSPLTAIVFDGVDKLQHLCWRFIRPEDDRPLSEPWEFEIREACLDYYRHLDSIIERMCALAGPEATVLMASDHGFGPTWEVLHINAWLEREGFLSWNAAAHQQETQGAVLGVGHVARHTFFIDWSKTLAYATTPTSNGIYIVVSEDGTTPGVKRDEYVSFRARLAEKLRELRDPESGAQVVTGIWTKEEAYSGPYETNAPDLTLALRDGGLVSILPSENVMSKRSSLGGAHRPVGIFAARGPGLKTGLSASELSILDVAPLMMHSLGLPVPEGMDGQVPESIFESAWLEAHPVRRSADGASPAAAAAPMPEVSAEDQQVVLERLKELGYIE